MNHEACLLLLVFSLVLPACNGGGDGSTGAPGAFALHEGEAGAGQAITLNPSGPFLTTPAWLPDGSALVARGRGGEGLYLLGTSGGAAVIDPSLRGFMEWIEEGNSFCLHRGAGVEIFTLDKEAGLFRSILLPGSQCFPGRDPYDTERNIGRGGGAAILYDLYTGRIRVLSQGGEAQVEAQGAWGAAVSPGGERIAYCLGHLKNASLHIYDVAGGSAQVLAGAHPAWLPDGKTLVFARAEADGADGTITHSELFLYDAGTGAPAPLTDTPGVIEMQPAPSPDGAQIAFCDWRTGSIMVIPSRKEVRP